ncbi:MAG: tRNA 2-thiouridine(34) synthase MnmA [Oscillospiraceae bacterium]|nr:tRNA 2-thiouridine(34) synthase MnmA [Oscillospiraceae bacterium]
MGDKALIAMSGGVDSSVAAYLMKQRGFECIGATMKLHHETDESDDAQRVAESLGIPFFAVDFSADFQKEVIGRFVEAYINGATPNPCIDCNREIKFKKLFGWATRQNIERVATGHYAQIERDGASGRHILKKAADCAKDQSYVLYFMTQEQLKRAIFPLGGLHKHEVRAIAASQGFANAEKKESQDICFVPDGDYAGFIERYTGKTYEGGDFADLFGNVLGRHKGMIRYTIGQRKGLGLALAKPMYVRSKNAENNTITLCENENLFTKSLDAADFNWIAREKTSPMRIRAKTRYGQKEQWATAEQVSKGVVHVEFDKPQRAITKGQAAVLYDGDAVVGGGTIV